MMAKHVNVPHQSDLNVCEHLEIDDRDLPDGYAFIYYLSLSMAASI